MTEKRLAPGQCLHVRHSILTEQRPDGRWDAWYAVYDWRETADSRDAAADLAAARSRKEDATPTNTGARANRGYELGIRVVDGEHIPGVEAEIISTQEYYDYMFELITRNA